jgi:hypothetical protein
MNWRSREWRRTGLRLCMRPTFCLITGMDESLMANEEITSREGL